MSMVGCVLDRMKAFHSLHSSCVASKAVSDERRWPRLSMHCSGEGHILSNTLSVSNMIYKLQDITRYQLQNYQLLDGTMSRSASPLGFLARSPPKARHAQHSTASGPGIAHGGMVIEILNIQPRTYDDICNMM